MGCRVLRDRLPSRHMRRGYRFALRSLAGRKIVVHTAATAVPTVTRRTFLSSAIVGVTIRASAVAAAQAGSTKLVLLGTGGGPRPRAASSAAAQVIVSNGTAYVIDCGDGVARQLALA